MVMQSTLGATVTLSIDKDKYLLPRSCILRLALEKKLVPAAVEVEGYDVSDQKSVVLTVRPSRK